VICRKHEEEAVKEFFELFKTPWEFWNAGRVYEVIISTEENTTATHFKLLVIYNSNTVSWDEENRVAVAGRKNGLVLKYGETEFPVYGEVATLECQAEPVLRVKNTGEVAGIINDEKEQKVVRAGFDLFQEIYFLLSNGQPVEFAHIPTLDIHTSMLRKWILKSGIPVIEIPPVPAGYDFICCLTHDVDFAGIRHHIFDRTMFGFVYRALIGSVVRFLQRELSFSGLLKNWRAVGILPFVYLGLAKDFWFQFDHYAEIEKGLGSTFYFLPFKDRPGSKSGEAEPKLRAGKYDPEALGERLKTLESNGCEIGLHGIDAWHDFRKAKEEHERISSVSGNSEIGVRMHWLYFNRESPVTLEEAGFSYDSTAGYNDAVGYWGGTTQVFRPIGSNSFMELPLNIQDTAMFYPDRMALGKNGALQRCKEIIQNAQAFGGVLVINWHHRSLAPERLWGGFYETLLKQIKAHKASFTTAKEAVWWFKERRRVNPKEMESNENGVSVRLQNAESSSTYSFVIRVHVPQSETPVDIPFDGKSEKEFHISFR